jgi:class 3 adenylate cyclase
MAQLSKVLLVDDEPDTLRLVRRILQADGFHVVEAKDGREALALFKQEQPDLILLDIIIPHIDGMRVLRQIREQDGLTGIIMVSALNSERVTIECMQAGADDYVSKPFPLKEVRGRIKQVLEKTQLRRKNADLQRQLDDLNAKMAVLVRHYLPHQVAEQLLKEPGLPSLGGTRQEVTILFVDLRSFTPLAESLPPDKLINILNRYLSAIAETAQAHEGTLDKFMGDGAMILFNAPLPQPDHVARAVRAALDIKAVVEGLTVLPEDQRLSLSIGIHTGDAVVGNIGSRELMNYTAIGDTVVLAKRLQETAESGQILVSEEVYRQVKDIVATEEVGIITVKGRIEPVHAYNILRLKCEGTDQAAEERS